MSTLKTNAIYDASGGSNAVLYGVAAPVGGMNFRNRIINGDMRIAQRGTASTTQGYSTVDRFYCNRNGGVAGLTISQVYGAFGLAKYSLAMQRDAGNGTTNVMVIYQAIEGANCRDLAGQNVTVSFQIGGGTVSSSTGHIVNIAYQTTTTDTGPTGGGWTELTAQAFTVAGSFAQKTATFAIPSNATQLMLIISLAVSGTAGADDRFYITEIQLEAGSVATPFERRPYGTELALCQRYYVRFPTAYWGAGLADSGNAWSVMVTVPVPMRSQPSVTNSADISGIAANGGLYNLNAASANIPNGWWNGSNGNIYVTTTSQISVYTMATGRILNLQCNAEL